jgi:hypothetical protein
MKTKEERFALASDIEFYDACLNFMDALKLSSNPLQTIGHRVALIEELEKKGFTITKTDEKIERINVAVDKNANVELINLSWIRWYMPNFENPNHEDFSKCGNIDLPKHKCWKIKERMGNIVTVEEILTD